MMRNLCIGIGDKNGLMTSGYLTALELGMAHTIFERWILPGDMRRADADDKTMNALPTTPSESIWSDAAPVDRLLTQFADAQNVSYIGIVPQEAHLGTEIAGGKSAGGYLSVLQTELGLMHKWRGGLLLFNTPLWFYGDDAQYPYSIVKQLRKSKEDTSGRPPAFQDIADAVTTLSDAQMKRLAKEFPQVESNKVKRPLFALYKKYPNILGGEGAVVDLNMLSVMEQLTVMPPIASKETLTRIRILEQGNPQFKDGRRSYDVQVQTMQHHDWQNVGIVTIFPGERKSAPPQKPRT